jgi:uncharacterized membrane protein YgdD (TMEM256/DUF423 family)
MDRDRILLLAALLGASAVALGAFGAHGLKGHVDAAGLATWKTAAGYHLAHAVALAAIAEERHALAAKAFTAGVLLFSGSLYLLVLTGVGWLGAITPLGGLFLIGGWLALAWAHRPGRPPWSA